jgi:hypothetical protein
MCKVPPSGTAYNGSANIPDSEALEASRFDPNLGTEAGALETLAL